jgi:hypothetical protein
VALHRNVHQGSYGEAFIYALAALVRGDMEGVSS